MGTELIHPLGVGGGRLPKRFMKNVTVQALKEQLFQRRLLAGCMHCHRHLDSLTIWRKIGRVITMGRSDGYNLYVGYYQELASLKRSNTSRYPWP